MTRKRNEMSQQEVFDLLRKVKKGLTSREIYNKLVKAGSKVSLGTITTNLHKLRNGGNSFVIMYYPEKRHTCPRYILREHANKNMIAKEVEN